MLSDGFTEKQSAGEARDDVEVHDVANLLLASVKRGDSSQGSSSTTMTEDIR